jgi:hypothetical protein
MRCSRALIPLSEYSTPNCRDTQVRTWRALRKPPLATSARSRSSCCPEGPRRRLRPAAPRAGEGPHRTASPTAPRIEDCGRTGGGDKDRQWSGTWRTKRSTRSGGRRGLAWPGCPGRPPGLRPVGCLAAGLGASGGSAEGGTDELEEFRPSRSSSSRTRASSWAMRCSAAARAARRRRHSGQGEGVRAEPGTERLLPTQWRTGTSDRSARPTPPAPTRSPPPAPAASSPGPGRRASASGRSGGR